ncbi:MAG: hypothetical protein ACRDDM_06425 [Paraclostridium sp.]
MQEISPEKSNFIPYSTEYKYLFIKKASIPQGFALSKNINKVEDGINDTFYLKIIFYLLYINIL